MNDKVIKENNEMDLGICPECKEKKILTQFYADTVDYHREFECLSCGFTASE